MSVASITIGTTSERRSESRTPAAPASAREHGPLGQGVNVAQSSPYVITPQMHALMRVQAQHKAAAARDEKRRQLRKRLDRESEERQLERYGVARDDPRFPLVYKAVVEAGMRGMDTTDAKVAREVADKALSAYERTQNREDTDVVYYVQVGDLIKVGTTSDMKRRLRAYPPNAVVLATETGSFLRETERVEEFAEYLAGRREWFHPGPRLMAHITELRRVASANG